MNTVQEFAFADLDGELATTRRFLALVPDDHLDWKPHDKSTPLGRLAMHLAQLVGMGPRILTTEGGFDMPAGAAPPRPMSPRADVLAAFDTNVAALKAAMATADDAALEARWRFSRGGAVIADGTRATVMRRLVLSHIIHHRAQLGVYYRLLDIPVPSSYGPSADEG